MVMQILNRLRNGYVLQAPIVAAAGVLAGGEAAHALGADKGLNTVAGGGIPGVTGTTPTKGSGPSTPQVDPSTALNYFSQAASTQNAGYAQGINYYGDAITNAGNDIRTATQQADATLSPLSVSSNEALNQQMRMLGLDPVQATASYGDALRTAVGTVNNTPGINSAISGGDSYVNSIATLMDQATALKDPAARAQALAGVQSAVSSGNSGLINGIQSQLTALKAPTAVDLSQYGLRLDNNGKTYVDIASGQPLGAEDAYDAASGNVYGINMGGGPSTGNTPLSAFSNYIDYTKAQTQYASDLDSYNSQKSALQDQLTQATGYTQQISDYGNQFAANYGANYDAGYTPAQISGVVTQLPGYQFQLGQGLQAIDAQAASKGLLASANTQLSEQNFGQGQAQSYYNQYMGYLSGITQQGAAATGQISANQLNQGTALANLQQSYGQAQMQTAQAQADYAANMLYQSGQLFNQDAMFNTGLQFQAQQNAANRSSQSANTAVSSGAGYLNASTAAGNLALAQQNSAGTGAGLLASYGANPYAGANYSNTSTGWVVNPPSQHADGGFY